MSDTPLPDISHDQHAVRRNKLAEMRAGGFDPFRANVATSHFSGDAIKLHVDGQDNAVTVTVAEGDTVDPAGLAPRLELWANWQTTEEGITFSFDDGQLGGRGIRSYTVPWSSARLVLSEYGEALLAPR